MRKSKKIIIAFLISLMIILFSTVQAWGFQHPGMLHSRADLDRMKQMVSQGVEPWKSGWAKMQSSSVASLSYTPHPVVNLSVASGGGGGQEQQSDANSAHFHAVQYYITGNVAHAQKAIEILNAWSYTLNSISGSNAKLQCGITGFKFCNAAEIIRYTYSGWPAADINQFKNMMLNIYYPIIQDFQPTYNGNWDAYMIATMMSIGVFCDDQAKFDKAVDYYLNGSGNGAVRNYIYDTGQCQESTRDQMHVQMGLGALAVAAETGYRQGLDLYGAYNNRLLLGFEYSGKYNLGYEVPCVGTISPDGRGVFRPIWEIVYNHYVKRKGLSAPYTAQVAGQIRPEGYDCDFICFGTLFFSLGNYTPTPPATITPTPTPTTTLLPPGTNLALNKPVTCSSQQTGNEAIKIADGNTVTRWSASPYPQWVRIDFGATYSINKTELVPYSDRAYQYKIEVSTDGTTFTQIVNKTGNTTAGSLFTDTFTAVNARYVRITVTGCANYTGTWASINEFRVFSAGSVATPTATVTPTPTTTPIPTPSPLVNLALNKPVTFSSEQTGNEASHIVDGEATTSRWSASPYPQWVRIDLGAVHSIRKTELVPYSDRAYQYKVEVSTDGTNFTQVVNKTGNTTGGSLLTDTFTAVNARYVRLTVTGCYNYTGTWASIVEFRVFGN